MIATIIKHLMHGETVIGKIAGEFRKGGRVSPANATQRLYVDANIVPELARHPGKLAEYHP